MNIFIIFFIFYQLSFSFVIKSMEALPNYLNDSTSYLYAYIEKGFLSYLYIYDERYKSFQKMPLSSKNIIRNNTNKQLVTIFFEMKVLEKFLEPNSINDSTVECLGSDDNNVKINDSFITSLSIGESLFHFLSLKCNETIPLNINHVLQTNEKPLKYSVFISYQELETLLYSSKIKQLLLNG